MSPLVPSTRTPRSTGRHSFSSSRRTLTWMPSPAADPPPHPLPGFQPARHQHTYIVVNLCQPEGHEGPLKPCRGPRRTPSHRANCVYRTPSGSAADGPRSLPTAAGTRWRLTERDCSLRRANSRSIFASTRRALRRYRCAFRPTAGGWRLAAGGWRLAAGGWRLAAGGWRLAVPGRAEGAQTSGRYPQPCRAADADEVQARVATGDRPVGLFPPRVPAARVMPEPP